MGKWKRDVLVAIKDPRFRIIMAIMNAARLPLDWFVHYLSKKPDRNDQPLGFARLAFYKAEALKDELQLLTHLDSTDPTHPWAAILSDIPREFSDRAAYTIKAVTHRNLADYDRRVISVFCSLPVKALCLAKTDPFVGCTKRQQVADEILKLHDGMACVDPTMLKLKRLFHTQLQEARDHGVCDMRLWTMLRLICNKWQGDVQEIEGINSLIKHANYKIPSHIFATT